MFLAASKQRNVFTLLICGPVRGMCVCSGPVFWQQKTDQVTWVRFQLFPMMGLSLLLFC